MATDPPRTLDVRKYAESRATELNSLHTLISNRLNNDFRSRRNKRRRTTGFQTTKTKKRKKPNNSEEREKNPPSRRARRRAELKMKGLQKGFSVSGDGTKRLRTHVWFAKRFRMVKLWGFYLPLGLHGRGRGSRAVLKWYKQGTVVHDASYYGAVQLDGPEESLLSILNMLLVPSPVDCSQDVSRNILSGVRCGSGMLHHAEHGGSKAICPVNYMWRPFHNQENGVGAEDRQADDDLKTEQTSHFRRLWIWMHPSSFMEGLECLKLSCTKQMDETGVMIDCVSVDEQLGRLEVMGSGAFQLLEKILHPCSFSVGGSPASKDCSVVEEKHGTDSKQKSALVGILQSCTHLLERSSTSCSMTEGEHNCDVKQNNNLEKAEYFSSESVVSLTVVDPRSLLGERTGADLDADLACDLKCLVESKSGESCAADEPMKEEVLSTLQSNCRNDSALSNSKDLWDVSSKSIQPPVEESILCLERHRKSLDFYCVKDATSGLSNSTEPQISRSCPILLVNNTDQAGHMTGWSIILPLNWVKAFWMPLVSAGAHAIGLREKHWIACDVGFPNFPADFPDCNAYNDYREREAAEVDKLMESRPPAMRPFKVPIIPPWNSIHFAFDENAARVKRIDSFSDVGSRGDSSSSFNSKIGIDSPVGSTSLTCEVFVTRTTKMLSSFLEEISGGHLLLFPMVLDRKPFSCLSKDEARISQASNVANMTSQVGRLCYLRVLLHAYKEGAFDEGAVVCAPHFSDLTMWTSRSENDEAGLQVPDASIVSYFKQQSSGAWEFQLPADPAAKKAFRRPIGFVTTGFVRGSKRPSAVAVCEAVELAHLRYEQWSQVPVKRRRKEIFVLVRNLRSTAYRLALATIFLEEYGEDVKSL